MYYFMYVDTQKIPEEGHFSATKIFVENYKKFSKPWLVLSYICSEYYELDQNFDYTELGGKSDHTSNDQVKLFNEIIVVIE